MEKHLERAIVSLSLARRCAGDIERLTYDSMESLAGHDQAQKIAAMEKADREQYEAELEGLAEADHHFGEALGARDTARENVGKIETWLQWVREAKNEGQAEKWAYMAWDAANHSYLCAQSAMLAYGTIATAHSIKKYGTHL